MKLPERRIFQVAAVIFVGLLMAACGSSSGGGSDTTAAASGSSGSGTAGKCSSTTSLTFAEPILNLSQAAQEVAQRAGYFTKHCLSVKFIDARGGTNTVAAVVSGSVQLGGTDPLVVFNAVNKNAPVTAVGTTSYGIPFSVVVSKQVAQQRHLKPTTDVKTMLNDIKGLTVGNLAAGDTGQLILGGLLHHAGLPANWITPNSVRGASTQLAALQHNQIQATFTDAPVPQTAAAAGYGMVLFNLTAIPAFAKYPYGNIIANPSWASAHASVVKQFLAALNDAQTLIANNPQKAASLLQSLVPTTPASVVVSTLKQEGYKPGTAQSVSAWNSSLTTTNAYHMDKFTVTPSMLHSSYTTAYSGSAS